MTLKGSRLSPALSRHFAYFVVLKPLAAAEGCAMDLHGLHVIILTAPER
jgi:hypothetical protein